MNARDAAAVAGEHRSAEREPFDRGGSRLKRLLVDPVDSAVRVRRRVSAARAWWTAARDRSVLAAFHHATNGTTSTNWLTRKPLRTWWGVETNLEELDLNWNRLSGSLPPELGRLLNLEALYLNNRLCGPLPPELGRLVRLDALDLSGNDLTGCVPSEWLKNVTEVDLSGNRLGRIPRRRRRDVLVAAARSDVELAPVDPMTQGFGDGLTPESTPRARFVLRAAVAIGVPVTRSDTASAV